MTTHYADFNFGRGSAPGTVELFAIGSDTVAKTAGAITTQTNRKGVARATFSDVSAGTYLLIGRDSTTQRCSWNVIFAGTDNEIVSGRLETNPTLAEIVAGVWSAASRTITGLTQAALALFVTVDTGQTEATAGSVAKLGQSSVEGLADEVADAVVDAINAAGDPSGAADCPEIQHGGLLVIAAGDDYHLADGRARRIRIDNWPADATIESAKLSLRRGEKLVRSTAFDASDSDTTKLLDFDFLGAETLGLAGGNGDGEWGCDIKLTNGHNWEPVTGLLKVVPRVGPPL